MKSTTTNSKSTVHIKPPNFAVATFKIRGTAPLVIHRFSAKTKLEMTQKMETGKPAANKRTRQPQSTAALFEGARYRSKHGWDGFHAASIRNAMIGVCRLVDYKMTLAKLSIFVEADGVDAKEPQVPLIRIYGKPREQHDMARVDNGNPYVTVRAAYDAWESKVRIRYDADQFTLNDVTNLLMRVGMQAGIGEGRPNSKNSAGMGWGLFEVV